MAYKTKYYAYDIGIRNAVVDNWKNLDLPKIIENIVYLELLKRGYNVKIGKTYSWEVDFVAFKNGTITYIQVCESLYSEEKYKQELDPLKSIKDNYEKIVITYQKDIRENDNGIKIVSLIDFLRKH
jgi:predicted AAA+ superfamily ATPase